LGASDSAGAEVTDTPEALTPEMAREEVAEMNADKDHPLHDPGHPKHISALDYLTELLIAQDAKPVERYSETGEHSTADLEGKMADAMQPVESPEGFSFDAFDHPKGEGEWDVDQENEFRQIFFNAGLSQPEVDQLQVIASSGAPVDYQRTEAILQSRYGENTEQMQSDIAIARAAIRKAGGQPLLDYLNDTGLGDSIQVFDLALRKAKEWGIENEQG